jgi:hypothetical protein
MSYRIESDYPLTSDDLPATAFKHHYDTESVAIATAIEGVDDPEEMEVRVICVETGEVVWRSTEEEFEREEWEERLDTRQTKPPRTQK